MKEGWEAERFLSWFGIEEWEVGCGRLLVEG